MTSVSGGEPITRIATLDAILAAHADVLRSDFAPYRHHAYRVANLCAAGTLLEESQLEKIAIAAAFHDLGIWTDNTFDYLDPSVAVATAYLAESGRAEWTAEITAMILHHHKITPFRGRAYWLVEPFRRADWLDVTAGFFALGAMRRYVRAFYAIWPGIGFHKRLVQLEMGQLRAHPLNPLPMFRF